MARFVRMIQKCAGYYASNQTSPSIPQNAKILFLHHSTGGVIWGGGVANWFTSYNSAHGTNYQITERAYPDSPYPWANYPYDYWNIWINPNADSTALSQDNLDVLTAQYDVIIFKHCYPVSEIEADTGNPSISSSRQSIENYQLQYAALKAKLHTYPDTKFIVWTGAAATQNSDAGNRTRSRQFFNWVKSTWDESGDNIYIWDFYELETEGGDYILPAYGTGDGHPNGTFATRVAPYFCKRIVNVIRGENLSDNICDT